MTTGVALAKNVHARTASPKPAQSDHNTSGFLNNVLVIRDGFAEEAPVNLDGKKSRMEALVNKAGGVEAIRKFEALKLSDPERKELWKLRKEIRMAESLLKGKSRS